jgi:hypothetical protein
VAWFSRKGAALQNKKGNCQLFSAKLADLAVDNSLSHTAATVCGGAKPAVADHDPIKNKGFLSGAAPKRCPKTGNLFCDNDLPAPNVV